MDEITRVCWAGPCSGRIREIHRRVLAFITLLVAQNPSAERVVAKRKPVRKLAGELGQGRRGHTRKYEFDSQNRRRGCDVARGCHQRGWR